MTTTPKILLKKSSVAGRVPGASDLDYGELAINFEDGKIYYKDASNNINAFIDSARVEAIANAVEVVAQAQLDSSEVTDLIDSDYIQLRIPETYLAGIIDSAYVAARQVYYTTFDGDFDTRLATKSTDDVSEGTNLYYTKARADSDIASSLSDSGNSVSITINNTITDTVDSDYVLARVAEAPFLDSADTIQLIDSAYIQARESTPYIPTFGTDFVDSATVSTIITTDVDKAFIDSLDVDASTLNNQAASYYLDYSNLNNTPTVLDATNVNSLIDTRVDKSFVDALNVDADTLDGQNGTHYLDYTNFTNTPALIDSGLTTQLIDSAYIQLRDTPQDFAYASLTGAPTIPQMDVDFVDSARVIRMISNEALDSDLTIALVDSAYIQLRDRFQDSSLVTTTVDNAYVQARQIQYNTSDFTDSAFVTGLPVSTFTNDAGYLTPATVGGLDSDLVIQIIDSTYVQARQVDLQRDSGFITTIVDSAYVAARTTAGTDSATVISLINSTVHDSDVAINLNNLVELGLGKNVTQNSYTSVNATVTGSRYGDGSTSGFSTAHPYLQVSSLTNFLAGMDSGEAIWVSSDGVNFTNPSSVTWTGGYITNANGNANLIQLSTNVNFWTYSGQTVYSGADVLRRSLRLQGDSSSSKIIASKNLSIEGDNGATITVAGYNIKDSGTVTSIIDSAYINARVDPFDSSHVINLVDSAYISLRDRFQDSSGIIAIVDSAYVQARQTTGGGGTVDSAYVLSVVDSSATPLLQNTLHYTADSGQVTFTGADDDNQTLAYSVGQLSVYLNGIFLIDSVDYTATNGTSVILIDSAQAGDVLSVTSFSGNSLFGPDSAAIIQLIDSDYIQARTTAGTDSASVISLIDSAYINARVNPFDSSHVLDLVDSAYIQLRDRFQDSSGILSIVDSAYVQLRQSGGLDSALVTQLIDSDYILAKKFVPGDAERRWNITSAAPTGTQAVSTGDYWVDRDDEVLYKLTASTTWTTTLPAGTFTAEAGLTSTNWFQTQSGGDATAFNIDSPTGPNGTFDRTFNMGTSPYNSGGRWTFTNPVTFGYFTIGNTASGHIWKIGYTDGSYAVSNNSTKTATPSSLTWYDAGGSALGKTTGFISGTNDFRHPNGTLASYIIVGRNNYGTRRYSSWMFFAGANSWQRVGEIYDSSDIKGLIDSDYVRLQTRIGDSDINFGSNKILYSNVYSAEGDLPSASDYHGMFAHVHGTGAGYFAHAGNWVKLANYSDINPYSDAHVTTLVDSAYIALRDRFQDSAGISAIVDSAYVQARQTTGGSGTVDSADIIAIVDSAYVQARQTSGGGAGGLDSALISQLIDSDYIGSKVDFTRGEFSTQRSQYTATASQTVFNHSSIDASHLDVYLNGVLQVVNDDYTADTSAVTFASGVDSGYSVSIIERRGRVATSRGLVENKFQFTTASPTTIITGTDDTGKTLDYSNGLADVYLNGILLRDSNDYASNSGTSVTLVSATDSGDLVTIINRRGLVTSPTVGNYEFTANSGQTVFTGNDINGQTLAYTPDAVQVHLNGIVLRNSDYIATNGTTVTLSTAADSADEILVAAFSNPGHNMEMYKFVADSAQTLFQGQDVTGASFAYEPGNIQVFLNGLLLNDSDDYLASNGIGVNLLSGAALNDELKVTTFTSNSRYVPRNTWSAPSGTPVSANAGDKLFIDTSTAKTITLPTSAYMGDEIRIIDVTGNAETNNITVGRNGHNIQGAASDLIININRTALGLVYYDAAQGWLLTEN